MGPPELESQDQNIRCPWALLMCPGNRGQLGGAAYNEGIEPKQKEARILSQG